jgi:hypothetical protein
MYINPFSILATGCESIELNPKLARKPQIIAALCAASAYEE